MSFRGTVPTLWRTTMRCRHCASVSSVQMPLGTRFGHSAHVSDTDKPTAAPYIRYTDMAAPVTAPGKTEEVSSLEEPGNFDRYDNMSVFELENELQQRQLHHIYPGRTFDDMRVRLRKSDGGIVPSHWMCGSLWTPPSPDELRDDPPTLSTNEIRALHKTALVEVFAQRGLRKNMVDDEMRRRLQVLESGQQVPNDWVAGFKSTSVGKSGYNSMRRPQLEKLLRDRGLKGEWVGSTKPEMARRLRASDESQEIPNSWRLVSVPNYVTAAEAGLYNGLTKAEISCVLKARGLRDLELGEGVDDAIRWLVACDNREAIPSRRLALGQTRIHDIDSAEFVKNIISQRAAVKPVYSRLSSLDPNALPLTLAASDPVAKRARDYDAIFTYRQVRNMCKQEGLRWQAPSLAGRVVNIRKDILCYRLALKEAGRVEEDWLLESLDIPKYAAKPDSKRVARPQITNRDESFTDYHKMSYAELRSAIRGRGLPVVPDEALMAFKLVAHENNAELPKAWFGPFGRLHYAKDPRVIELQKLGKDELVRRLREADIPFMTRWDLLNKLIESYQR